MILSRLLSKKISGKLDVIGKMVLIIVLNGKKAIKIVNLLSCDLKNVSKIEVSVI